MGLRFDYVLFDLGNTLLYYDAPWPGSLEEATRALTDELVSGKVPINPARFNDEFLARMTQYYTSREIDYVEVTTLDVLKSLLTEHGVEDVPIRQLRAALAAMYAVSQSYWHVEEDTLPMFENLNQAGYRMGLVTNASDSDDVQVLVDKAGIRGYLDVIVISADIGLRKPHPRIFKTALKFWDAKPGQAVMVGDLLPADILGANEMGIGSIWITRRASQLANQPYLETVEPDMTITSLAELPAALLNFWRDRVE